MQEGGGNKKGNCLVGRRGVGWVSDLIDDGILIYVLAWFPQNPNG